ncbi:lipid-A-disaccharide synthase [Engelhardtia mirabilis]|uniref:lipid-A-disaccharide synthase n=1 Tax=Engelhardtia mirabilis TaxID=2528011 RepID=UPI003AF37BF3
MTRGHSERRARHGLPPQLAVAREFARALGALLLGPLRLVAYFLTRRRLEAEVLGDLRSGSPPDDPPALSPPAPELDRGRPLRVFISCAEPSGELHARHLIDALCEVAAEHGLATPTLTGLGGERLDEKGVRRVGDPVAKSAMGFGVVAALPFYLRLLTDAARELRDGRPNLMIAVDSPALHVPLGHIARGYGVPVVHFVTPQYWGWAPWRVGGYRAAVDLALSILPFEPPWFDRHRVRTAHVGHPIQDALARVPANPDPDRCSTLALLPGSRNSVLRRNLPWMLGVVAELRQQFPELRVALPHDRTELEPTVRELVEQAGATDWVDLRFGSLHATLRDCRAAFSVSGTVLLDLLHHRLPTAVVYRVDSKLEAWLAQHVLTVPFFASTNLLVGREVCPEWCFAGDGPRGDVLEALRTLWVDGPERSAAREGLDLAASRLGQPGANRRAAHWALAEAGRERADV